MLLAIVKGRFPMPWKTFFTALLCAVYVISPADFLPDVLPLLGIADDATFVLLVLAMIKKDIARFRAGQVQTKDKVIDLGDIKDYKKRG